MNNYIINFLALYLRLKKDGIEYYKSWQMQLSYLHLIVIENVKTYAISVIVLTAMMQWALVISHLLEIREDPQNQLISE